MKRFAYVVRPCVVGCGHSYVEVGSGGSECETEFAPELEYEIAGFREKLGLKHGELMRGGQKRE